MQRSEKTCCTGNELETRVAEKQLISAQAGARHLQPRFANRSRDEPRVGPVDAVDVHRGQRFIQPSVSAVELERNLGMTRAEVPCDSSRLGCLVIRPTWEGDGERSQIQSPGLHHER